MPVPGDARDDVVPDPVLELRDVPLVAPAVHGDRAADVADTAERDPARPRVLRRSEPTRNGHHPGPEQARKTGAQRERAGEQRRDVVAAVVATAEVDVVD